MSSSYRSLGHMPGSAPAKRVVRPFATELVEPSQKQNRHVGQERPSQPESAKTKLGQQDIALEQSLHNEELRKSPEENSQILSVPEILRSESLKKQFRQAQTKTSHVPSTISPLRYTQAVSTISHELLPQSRGQAQFVHARPISQQPLINTSLVQPTHPSPIFRMPLYPSVAIHGYNAEQNHLATIQIGKFREALSKIRYEVVNIQRRTDYSNHKDPDGRGLPAHFESVQEIYNDINPLIHQYLARQGFQPLTSQEVKHVYFILMEQSMTAIAGIFEPSLILPTMSLNLRELTAIHLRYLTYVLSRLYVSRYKHTHVHDDDEDSGEGTESERTEKQKPGVISRMRPKAYTWQLDILKDFAKLLSSSEPATAKRKASSALSQRPVFKKSRNVEQRLAPAVAVPSTAVLPTFQAPAVAPAVLPAPHWDGLTDWVEEEDQTQCIDPRLLHPERFMDSQMF